jgi:transposase
MAEFEESRRAIRSSVVAAALAEGASVTQISGIFGVSRQLANRFVKECRAREQQQIDQLSPPQSI